MTFDLDMIIVPSMNIFILSTNPVEAAQMQCDKHVVKMVLESAQMLSTAHRILDGDAVNPELYRKVHARHPCTLWTMETDFNYRWHYKHFIALGEEYTFRYGKVHSSIQKLAGILSHAPRNIPVGGLTPFALAMKQYPECVVENNPVASYRNFYLADKKDFAKWTRGRKAPEWWNQNVELVC